MERNHVSLTTKAVVSAEASPRVSLGKDSIFTVPSNLGGVFDIVPTGRVADGRLVFKVRNPGFEECRLGYTPRELAREVLHAERHRPRPCRWSSDEALEMDRHHREKALETVRFLRSLTIPDGLDPESISQRRTRPPFQAER